VLVLCSNFYKWFLWYIGMIRKMKRRAFIGVVGLAAVGATSCWMNNSTPIVLPPKKIVSATRPSISNYKVIEAHERELTKFYLAGLRKVWRSGLDKAMKKYGDEKMHDVYFKLYLDTLDHAQAKINGRAGDDKRAFRSIAEKFTASLKKHDVQGVVDFTTKPVDDAYVGWAERTSDFYGKLLAQKNSQDFGELVRGAYPEKEGFEKLLAGQDKGIDLIYSAFSESVREGMGGLAFFPLRNAREHAKKFYRGSRMRDHAK
jgi:hypothetical protein